MFKYVIYYFFFFQAEDGIRDVAVTGVQTCALPIYVDQRARRHARSHAIDFALERPLDDVDPLLVRMAVRRSEERREGKSVDLGGRRIIKKKKRRYQCSVGFGNEM